jgi:diguanylate cyclase (GGDEF)-like protein/PAS domain S-box-containing protein
MTAQGPEAEALAALWRFSADGVIVRGPDGGVVAANPAICEMVGLDEVTLVEVGWAGLVDDGDDRWPALLGVPGEADTLQGPARLRRGDGTLVEVHVSTGAWRGHDGTVRLCTLVRDLSAQLAMERELEDMAEELRQLALTDELTGLRNRRGFLAVGAHMLEVADRHVSAVQLLYLDVDNMKYLNDTLGHAAGDAGLRAVAGALNRVLRHADVVSRIGGDEFVALILGLEEDGRFVVERRIDGYLRAAPTVAAVGRAVEVSIGWAARLPFGPSTVEDLLAEADRAMYRVKTQRLSSRS